LHGIDPDRHHLGIREIGSALIDAAERFESDLIVMGAYGHSRFRERILGGRPAACSRIARGPSS
jgi:nucleotide-binding universal stress UspA family protein